MALAAERLAVRVSNWLARPGILFIFLLLVTVRAFAGGATLSWDPVTDPDLSGYILHYGPTAGNYTGEIDVGDKTTHAISGLAEGATYHFAVTAYDVSGTESGFSNDVSTVIPYSTPVAPIAAFSASTTSGAAPLAMNFVNNSTGNITAYAWTFGDGTTSTAKSPGHLYSTAGVYTVTLKVTGPGGTNTQTRTNLITVTAPTATAPVAAFTASKTSGTAPLTVTFTSTSTGSITSYLWTFGDGTSSTSRNPTKVYTTAGAFTVSLKVTGSGGTSTRTSRITVTAPTVTAPVAAFTASKTSGTAPLSVTFTSTSTGSITSYLWTFGDGTSSGTRIPTKVYTTAGVYTVSLKVTGSGGTSTKSANITVGSAISGQTCPCSFWPASAKPAEAADSDTKAVELGVKFKSDKAGRITGIRFYKSSLNTGTHVGSLWTIDGKLLARATFASETASGWQQVNFSSAVVIAANTVYVASYHTNVGRYANDNDYFATKGADNGPLHALRDQWGQGNGVYAYGSYPSFPRSSYRATNYWVDVLFTPSI